MSAKVRNAQVVEAFIARRLAVNDGSSLRSTGTKLLSYSTVIGEWIEDRLAINTTPLTRGVTNAHRGILLRTHRQKIIRICNQVPKGAKTLKNYLINK